MCSRTANSSELNTARTDGQYTTSAVCPLAHCPSSKIGKHAIKRNTPELHLCLQRGLQRFFGQILIVYRRFRSILFTLRHSLKPVFPRVPRLSVANYVVKKIGAPKEALHKHNEALCNTLDFHPCISPFIPIDFRLLFRYCATCEPPQNTESGGNTNDQSKNAHHRRTDSNNPRNNPRYPRHGSGGPNHPGEQLQGQYSEGGRA